MTLNNAHGGRVWSPTTNNSGTSTQVIPNGKAGSSYQRILFIPAVMFFAAGVCLLIKAFHVGIVGITELPSVALSHNTYLYMMPHATSGLLFFQTGVILGAIGIGLSLIPFTSMRYFIITWFLGLVLMGLLSIISLAGTERDLPVNSLPQWVTSQIGNDTGVPNVDEGNARNSTTELKDTYGNKYILTVIPEGNNLKATLLPAKK